MNAEAVVVLVGQVVYCVVMVGLFVCAVIRTIDEAKERAKEGKCHGESESRCCKGTEA